MTRVERTGDLQRASQRHTSESRDHAEERVVVERGKGCDPMHYRGSHLEVT